MRNDFHRIVIAAAAIMLAAGAPRAVASPPAEAPPPRALHVWYYQGGQVVGEGFWDCDGQFYMLWGIQTGIRTHESVPLACPGGVDP